MYQHQNLRQPIMDNRNQHDDGCFGWLGRLVGIILLVAPAFLGYLIAWSTIALLGTVIFCGFSAAAIFLDTIRWVGTTYSQPRPDPEYLAKRLKKAAMIIVYIFQTMAELKPNDLMPGNQPPANQHSASRV